jgi:hypothetical protein
MRTLIAITIVAHVVGLRAETFQTHGAQSSVDDEGK